MVTTDQNEEGMIAAEMAKDIGDRKKGVGGEALQVVKPVNTDIDCDSKLI
jgi:hypothetical protein